MAKIPRLKMVSGPTDIPLKRKVAELIRVPWRTALYGPLCSEGIFAMPTHYIGDRTVLCEGEQCEWCEAASNSKWYGIVAIFDRLSTAPVWCQLTEDAATSLDEQIKVLQMPFYGAVVRIGRTRAVYNAPITVTVEEHSRMSGRLVRAMVPDETLEKVFGSPNSTPNLKLKVV